MEKAKRKRPNIVAFRMSNSELAALKEQLNESGLSRQDYLLRVLSCPSLTVVKKSEDEVNTLKDLNRNMNSVASSLRSMEAEVRQMNAILMVTDDCSFSEELKQFNNTLEKCRKDINKKWALIRLSINQENPM